jgi:hypothetical protein
MNLNTITQSDALTFTRTLGDDETGETGQETTFGCWFIRGIM